MKDYIIKAREEFFNKKVVSLFNDYLISQNNNIEEQISDYRTLKNKYPNIWEKIKSETIVYSITFSYLLILPGHDLKLLTDDDIIRGYERVVVFDTKIKEVIIYK